jgi:hypothetical protein
VAGREICQACSAVKIINSQATADQTRDAEQDQVLHHEEETEMETQMEAGS